MANKNRPSGPGSRTLLVALLLIVVFVVAASRLQACDAASGFCAGKCAVRCGRASGKQGKGKAACMQRCGLCCEECACVPTGKTGSRDECPCYRDMLTTGPKKRPKCP